MQPPARRTSGSGTRSVRIRTRHPCTKRHGRSRNASPSESSAGRCPMRCSARRNIRPAPGPTGRAKPDSQKSRAAARESSAEKHPVQHIRQLEDCQNKNAKKIRAGQQMAPCQTAASRRKEHRKKINAGLAAQPAGIQGDIGAKFPGCLPGKIRLPHAYRLSAPDESASRQNSRSAGQASGTPRKRRQPSEKGRADIVPSGSPVV